MFGWTFGCSSVSLVENILHRAGPAEPGLGLGLLIAVSWLGLELQ